MGPYPIIKLKFPTSARSATQREMINNIRDSMTTYLASRLVESEVVPELLLADSAHGVNLVPKDQEGHLGQLLDGQEGVELRLGLGEALKVGRVDEEDDTVDFREVVAPEAAGWRCECIKVSVRES